MVRYVGDKPEPIVRLVFECPHCGSNFMWQRGHYPNIWDAQCGRKNCYRWSFKCFAEEGTSW